MTSRADHRKNFIDNHPHVEYINQKILSVRKKIENLKRERENTLKDIRVKISVLISREKTLLNELLLAKKRVSSQFDILHPYKRPSRAKALPKEKFINPSSPIPGRKYLLPKFPYKAEDVIRPSYPTPSSSSNPKNNSYDYPSYDMRDFSFENIHEDNPKVTKRTEKVLRKSESRAKQNINPKRTHQEEFIEKELPFPVKYSEKVKKHPVEDPDEKLSRQRREHMNKIREERLERLRQETPEQRKKAKAEAQSEMFRVSLEQSKRMDEIAEKNKKEREEYFRQKRERAKAYREKLKAAKEAEKKKTPDKSKEDVEAKKKRQEGAKKLKEIARKSEERKKKKAKSSY
jgi:hypothetical protein